MSDLRIAQRYELAAELCRGLRVLDLSEVPDEARRALRESAAELCMEPSGGAVDAVVSLDGLSSVAALDRMLSELERPVGDIVRMLVVFERSASTGKSPRVEPPAEDAARALAERRPDSTVLRQLAAEGSLIEPADGDVTMPALDLRRGEARAEDVVALIVASGFGDDAVRGARASLRLTVAPVLMSYVRGLEAAHAELLRANRQLMHERVSRDGSAAASLLNAQRQLEEMTAIAKEHEAHVRRLRAWYDAPRYHLVDRIREGITKVPGFTGTIRFLWSLVSTRAETPQIDAAANRVESDAEAEAADVTREREGLDEHEERERPETRQRLEQ